jgi:predicted MPP superfamily phosphohydrolase
MFKKISLAIIIIMIPFIVYSLIEPYWIQTKVVVIESNQIPAEFDGKKIVFLSDIHCGSWPLFDQERTENLVNQVNALHPDIILLGGDYVNDNSPNVNPCFKELSKLKAPLGVYGVLGNNDPWNESIPAMKNANITYIGNNGLWIENKGAKIRIGGVGDMFTDIQNQDAATGDASKNDFAVLVSHSPDFFPLLNRSKVDVMLSGHTHGGQITLFGLWAPIIHSQYGNKYRTGIIRDNNTVLVVSNGIGTIKVPMRFFARPQIIVIKLKRNKKTS